MSRRREPGEETTLRALTQHHAVGDAGQLSRSALVLHVVHERSVLTFPLPDKGSVLIGRAPEADLRIDEPSISRRHAVVHVGPPLTVEDVGGANGVLVGGSRLHTGDKAPLDAGSVFELGDVMIVVQRNAGARRPRRIWSQAYFEGRVEDECGRAKRAGTAFAVARIHTPAATAAEGIEPVVSGVLSAADILASYGPGDLGALLLDAPSERANRIATVIASALASAGIDARVGVACFPGDAQAPAALLAQAASSAREPAATRRAPATTAFGASVRDVDTVLGRIARGNINVLITGETGVGKELAAERVHALSPRASAPLIRLNCAAFSETLLSSELFGHERGAFTGADRAKPGVLEQAGGGTVFLDEVGELPMSIQPKLLRVLEDRIVTRVGALKGQPVDLRFVAATNRDLEADVAQGRFRQDLYFRLNGFLLHLLPLRERAGDIPDIARGFLVQASQAAGLRAPVTLSEEVLDIFKTYRWPGNVRELRNVIDRAVLLCTDGVITKAHLPLDRMQQQTQQPQSPMTRPTLPPTRGEDPDPLRAALDAREKQRIEEALAQHNGNQTHAARALGISRGTLLSRIDLYDLARPRKRQPR